MIVTPPFLTGRTSTGSRRTFSPACRAVAVWLALAPLAGRCQSDDSLAAALVQKQIAINAAHLSMPGFRVQVYYGSQRARAMEVKSDFLRDHPEVSSYLVYQQPNFKVRVGDFKTRLEALRLLDDIHADYPAAFVVPDEVKLPELAEQKE
jgi:hypothetical protein